MIAGLRVSSVLTSFLVWPVLLAWAMGSFGWENLLAVPAYLAVIVLTCLTTATVALFCSVLFRKTATSMMTSYLIIGALFCLPLALRFFARSYFPQAAATAWIDRSR